MTLSPPLWTLEQLTQGVARGIEIFRDERLNEAREDYSTQFNEAQSAVEDLLELSTDLATLTQTGGSAVADAVSLEPLLSLAPPPVSFDCACRESRPRL